MPPHNVQWRNGKQGGRQSLDGRWSIVRLVYRRPSQFLVCERASFYVEHPCFRSIDEAKAYVDTRT